jgi:hypothetical protein
MYVYMAIDKTTSTLCCPSSLGYLHLAGPLLVVTVPPIRRSMGWKPTEKVPTSFPGKYKTALLSLAAVLEALTSAFAW